VTRAKSVGVKAPKILAVASAVDLDFRYGCTPAWWQLWKGLYEAGVDLIVTPYRGRPVESPWWRTAPNPAYLEGESFARARDLWARLKGDRYVRRPESDPGDTDRLVREVVWRWVTPRWRRHLERLVEAERPDAVLVFTVPMAHLRGIPTHLRERYDVPVVFYDGDVPMSLPEFGGMDTGFNYYYGADPGEYDLVVSNSEADPELFRPLAVEKEVDVFFYGYGDKFRREWMRELVGEPSRRLEDVDFALGGEDFQGDIGRARTLGVIPFNAFNRAISATRVSLNVTRRAHATMHASSTARPFELAMAGAAIVSNPVEGLDTWFEPGRELLIAGDADEATAAYRELLGDPGQAEELGARARERALDEHTYAHRARRLLELVGLGVQEPVA
jgi:glycosyl transferase family 1